MHWSTGCRPFWEYSSLKELHYQHCWIRCQIINIIWVIDIKSVWWLSRKSIFSHIVLKHHRGQWRRITLCIPFPPRSNLSINSHNLWCSDQFAICQKTDDQCILVRIVRVSIMTLKSGENTMIQGLNTNIAISLPSIWSPSFSFFSFVFFYWQINGSSWRTLLTVQRR